MFCEKCGKQISDDALFCAHCGNAIDDNLDPKDCQEKQKFDGNPAEDDKDDLEDLPLDLNTSGKISRKKVKILPVLLAVISVMLIAAAVVVLLIPGVGSFLERTFLSPRMLMANVYSRSAERIFDMQIPGSGTSGDLSMAYETHLLVGDTSLSFLSLFTGMDAQQIGELSDIGITCDTTRQGKLLKAVYDVTLTDTSILSAEQYVDEDTGEIWVLLPQLNSQPLYVNIQESMDSAQKLDQSVLNALSADPEIMEKITLRHMKMVLDSFENVEKSTKAVKLNGLTQRMTVLEAYTNEVELQNAMITVLESLLSDNDFQTVFGGTGGLAPQIESEIQHLLGKLRDPSLKLDADHGYTVYTYLNNRNEIVGVQLEYAGDQGTHDIFSFLIVSMGDDIAVECELFEDIRINGKGTVGTEINGTFKAYVSGTEFCSIELEKWQFDKDKLGGTLRIDPSDDLLNAVLSAAQINPVLLQFTGMLDPSVVMDISYGMDKAILDISLQTGSSVIVGLNVVATKQPMQTIELPAEFANTAKDADVAKWLSQVDKSAVAGLWERLIQAGVPEMLLPDPEALFPEASAAE